jgi:hypothetical protein
MQSGAIHSTFLAGKLGFMVAAGMLDVVTPAKRNNPNVRSFDGMMGAECNQCRAEEQIPSNQFTIPWHCAG